MIKRNKLNQEKQIAYLAVPHLAAVPLQQMHRLPHVPHVPQGDRGIRGPRREQKLAERVERQTVNVRRVRLPMFFFYLFIYIYIHILHLFFGGRVQQKQSTEHQAENNGRHSKSGDTRQEAGRHTTNTNERTKHTGTGWRERQRERDWERETRRETTTKQNEQDIKNKNKLKSQFRVAARPLMPLSSLSVPGTTLDPIRMSVIFYFDCYLQKHPTRISVIFITIFKKEGSQGTRVEER